MGRRRDSIEPNLTALATMSLAQLRDHWTTSDRTLPPNLPTPLLRRLLAQRLQERRFGALPSLVARELERVSQGEPAGGPLDLRSISPQGRGLCANGTVRRSPSKSAKTVSGGRIACGARSAR
ncbi:DUF2924 domain-containing protein [Novosphingobium sp. Gsoil 351]|nr:DUF2924 domain-containing protein [Novosphingobium sp. Gsoil 351]